MEKIKPIQFSCEQLASMQEARYFAANSGTSEIVLDSLMGEKPEKVIPVKFKRETPMVIPVRKEPGWFTSMFYKIADIFCSERI